LCRHAEFLVGLELRVAGDDVAATCNDQWMISAVTASSSGMARYGFLINAARGRGKLTEAGSKTAG